MRPVSGIDTLRDHLRLNAAFNGCPALLAVVGKTTALAALRERIDARLLPLISFDALGVPTDDEMTRCWDGGSRGWSKMMTYHWVYTARQIYRMRPLVILEGQFDPQYAVAACAAHRVRSRIVLLDDKTEATWIENTRSLGGTVLDAAGSPEAIAAAVAAIAFELVTQ